MEETKKGNTITIKIDGKSRQYKETSTIEPKSVDTTTHVKPIPVEREVAATEETEETFDWVLPEIDRVEVEPKEFKIVSNKQTTTKSLKKLPQSFLPSILFAFLFAVIIGTSIGVILLKMVTSEETSVGGELGSEMEPSQSSSQRVSLTLPALTAYVVQEGAYKTSEGAMDAKATLDGKGAVPTAVLQSDQSYMIIGLATSKDEAKQLAEQLKQKGVNVYAKEVQVGGAALTNLEPVEKEALELASTLYAPLSLASTSIALSSTANQQALAAIAEQESNWSKIKGESLKREDIKNLKTELDKAIELAKTGKATNSLELQQHLLSFLSIYQTIK